MYNHEMRVRDQQGLHAHVQIFEGYRNLFRVNANMAEDFSSLALQAGLAPVTDVVG